MRPPDRERGARPSWTGTWRRPREWEARATGIWAEIEQSVRLYIGTCQREGGYVRTGHHGRRVDGVEAGRFEDAHEIPVAIFPQHTSRNGTRSCTCTCCG